MHVFLVSIYFRQCRIHHMAEAAYATGPALLFFCFRAGPQRAFRSPPENSRPQKSTPNVFFLFPVLVFQRSAPKSPRSPENVIGPKNLKMEAPKCGAPNDFFVPCFSAGSKQRGALKSPRPPKAKPQTNKKTRGPKVKKGEAPKAGPQTQNLVCSFGQGAPKNDRKARNSYRVQKISKFAANCYILKDR